MSKYPLYVTFEDDHISDDGVYTVLNPVAVSYGKPEGEFYQIDPEEKVNFYGAFPDYPDWKYYDSYKRDWYVNNESRAIDFDPYDTYTRSSKDYYEGHLDIVYTRVISVMSRMLQMDKEIGSIWKLPDPLDCALYAMTEAAEYLEAVLLQVRTGDSRNNKSAESFDAAMEMFDTTMMALRSLMSMLYMVYPDEGKPEERDLLIINHVREEFLLYKHRRATDPEAAVAMQSAYLYEPQSLMTFATLLIQGMQEIGNPEVPASMVSTFVFDIVFFLCEYVIFHPVVTLRNYADLAEQKLDKIYNKSLAKMDNGK